MHGTSPLYVRDLAELHEALKLIPRQGSDCYRCDDAQSLTCPTCPSGQSCSYQVPDDCQSCTIAVCVPTDSLGSGDSNDDEGGQVNAGAIAGGVIGGIVLIALATYLVWRFLVKPKRSQLPSSIFEADSSPVGATEKDADERMTHRSSTHTVHSIASTVLTRASNIIQIAYIPGVTNRATPSSPTVLVPPVPPIPMHHTDGSRDSALDDPHFFVPGDLRDSTYSGLSGFSDRTSYARTSYAPRSSVASTIYGKQAPVVHPAQTGMRAKPTMVSVKSMANSGTSSYSGSSTPPVPALDLERFADPRPRSAASNFSVGSTFLNTATTARAQVVKVGGGLKKIEVGSKSDASTSSGRSTNLPSPDLSSDSSVHSLGAITLTASDRSPPDDQGPFSDPPERSNTQLVGNSTTLGAVMEEEDDAPTNRTMHRFGSSERENSPFDDHHATRG
ncbi:hypothetical protein S40285_01255 [Stachybotrys chlorohalonatus IBT 40285]|uniref:Uncharacterized protein n=1 Tax=Stachybotrys chlorohalonatus (strain IBT 40285) TaxID=1283841 RepID=A0A084QR04_STAC4|nr:hypothetical protein S40285_01255 [Stachybotrys chlorohalonata IBT 40285]